MYWLIAFLNLLIFNCRIIALQCCIGFCHTTIWISHKYIYDWLALLKNLVELVLLLCSFYRWRNGYTQKSQLTYASNFGSHVYTSCLSPLSKLCKEMLMPNIKIICNTNNSQLVYKDLLLWNKSKIIFQISVVS